MSDPTADHYRALGLPPNASSEQIRRRFRELARKYHPDISPDSDAAERFKQINAAHQVLSDPKRRAAYDAERILAEAQKQARGEGKPAPNWTSGAAQRQPTTPRERRPTRAPTQQETTEKIAWLLSEARMCLRRGRLREAQLYANHATRLDRACAEAYHVLGDVHRARRQTNEALAMYSFVLQLDPSHAAVRAKFDRLAGEGVRRSVRYARPWSSWWQDRRVHIPRSPFRLAAVVAGLSACGACATWTASPAIDYGWLFVRWAPATLFGLLAAGVSAGVVLAVSDLVDDSRRELRPSIFAHVAGGPEVPLGLVLAVVALAFFPAAFALFLLVSAARESVSTSWLRAFGATALVAAAFGLRSGAAAVLVFGGNLAFLGLLAGWLLGDCFRSPETQEGTHTRRR